MPYLSLQTNVEIKHEAQSQLLQKLSQAIKLETGKPETYIMVSVHGSVRILMGGKESPAAFVDLKSIGLPKSGNGGMSKAICKILQEELNVPPDRIYINFTDIDAAKWGWNGQTFA